MLAGARGTITVFVPTPNLVDPHFLLEVAGSDNRHRVVLVRPGIRAALITGFLPGGSRWASRTVAPECVADPAVRAGPAGVHHSRYIGDNESFNCYQGGLVGVPSGQGELIAVGATDPFRNSRLDEAGNRALATGLLSGTGQLIWVDVHRAERSKVQTPPPPRYRQPDRSAGDSNPMWAAFPPVLWAGLLLLFALGLLLAVVRGRRLGPPVAEPLPVLVPATEIITGRGRLYQRGAARETVLDALRTAALRRLARVVDPTRPTGADAGFIAQVAVRAGLAPDEVQAILYPPAPATDEELGHAVARLDALVDTVLRTTPRPADRQGTAGFAGAENPGGMP